MHLSDVIAVPSVQQAAKSVPGYSRLWFCIQWHRHPLSLLRSLLSTTALEDFWFRHILPAKEAVEAGRSPRDFCPADRHSLTAELKRLSMRISGNARQVVRGGMRPPMEKYLGRR